MSQIESEIIKRCQCGDKTAFRWIVQTYQQMIFSLTLKMLADEEEAKDAVQDTFIKAWTGIQSFDGNRKFSTWIYTIASRQCLDRMKSAHSVKCQSEDEEKLRRFASDSDSHRTLENSEWISIVRILAEGLSEKQRLVFTLCQLEGLTSNEVEEITQMDASQVKSNLYVARQTIRKQLKQLGYE